MRSSSGTIGGSLPRGRMSRLFIPFNKPWLAGNEYRYLAEAIEQGHISVTAGSPGCVTRYWSRNLGCARCCSPLRVRTLWRWLRCCSAPSRGRGDRSLVHLRFHSERVRVARRAAGVRRYSARHTEPGRKPVGAADYPRVKAIVPVHYAGVAARWTSYWRSARVTAWLWSRTTRMACSPSTKTGIWDLWLPGNAELPRDQEHQLRGRRRTADQ